VITNLENIFFTVHKSFKHCGNVQLENHRWCSKHLRIEIWHDSQLWRML